MQFVKQMHQKVKQAASKTRLSEYKEYHLSAAKWELGKSEGSISNPMTGIHVNLIRCSKTLMLLCEPQYGVNKLNN